MAEFPVKEPNQVDERLRQLLEIERRLEDLVRAANDAAARRLTAARDAGNRALSVASEKAERMDAECARREQAAHTTALASLECASRATVDAINGVTDTRVDALARWAVSQAIGATGEST
ncbi:MAG TPA: hypothetical protein VFT39_20535 [Vicinamibacterales bacterium]|nr:hypothetical protein [Vicinamibacterales bacterium]